MMIISMIKIKIRFDYIGKGKQGNLFGGKNIEVLAEECRQHQVSLIRNVPIQGIRIDDIDMSQEIYSVYDDIAGKKLAYAPVVITFYADNLEDAIKFSMKEEFRTIEVLEPDEINLSRNDIDRMLI
jgi:hypothetical protein